MSVLSGVRLSKTSNNCKKICKFEAVCYNEKEAIYFFGYFVDKSLQNFLVKFEELDSTP